MRKIILLLLGLPIAVFAALAGPQQPQATDRSSGSPAGHDNNQAAAPTPVPPAFNAYPTRPSADPAAVERGKILFIVNCGFCHGSLAKGGEGGPNLVV